MKQDIELVITRHGKEVWRCRAEALSLKPREADVDEEVSEPDVRLRLKFHYTRKLDPVLKTPSNYNIKITNRIVPDATILAIQQTADGRYVELSV